MPVTLISLAEQIFQQTSDLIERLKENSITEPSLDVGARTDLWTSQPTYLGDRRSNIEEAKRTIFGLTKQLTKLLNGPHEFLHEYVSCNWDHGALLALLEHRILDAIPLHGKAHVSELAAKTGLPERKLLCILRLNACEDIVKEVSDCWFAHTAISEEVLKDARFRAFLCFQYVNKPADSAISNAIIDFLRLVLPVLILLMLSKLCRIITGKASQLLITCK